MAGSIDNAFSDAFARAGVEPPKLSEPLPEGSAVEDRDDDLQQVNPGVICPGLVVLDLDPIALLEEPGVRCTASPATRTGPFLCVEVDEDRSVWVGLTSKWRIERLEILREWRSGGGERWRTRPQYLTDGATVYLGPTSAFAAASWREVFTAAAELPRISDMGVEAVRRRVEAAIHRKARAENVNKLKRTHTENRSRGRRGQRQM